MSLSEFIAEKCFKYLVIGLSDWQASEAAQQLAPAPLNFTVGETSYVIISLEPCLIGDIAAHIEATGSGYEIGFEQGTGKASFLTHDQALTLLASLDGE